MATEYKTLRSEMLKYLKLHKNQKDQFSISGLKGVLNNQNADDNDIKNCSADNS